MQVTDILNFVKTPELTQEERNWTGVEHAHEELYLSRNKQMILVMRREERRDKASN